MNSKKYLCYLILILISGCKLSQTTLIPKADIEHVEQYKCENYMGWSGRTYEATPPGSISKTAVQDECRIIKIEKNKTTIELLTRSHTSIDQDFSRYSLKVNGKRIAPTILEQSIEVRDYNYTGTYTVAGFSSIIGLGGFDLNISKPVEKTFRVMERKVKLICEGRPNKNKISIALSTKVEWNASKLGEVFNFEIM